MSPNLPEGYTVEYRHERVFKLAGHHMPSPEAKGGWTTAYVYNSNGELVAEGKAIVHPNDNYCKRIGRYVSLGRALKQLNQPPVAQRSEHSADNREVATR